MVARLLHTWLVRIATQTVQMMQLVWSLPTKSIWSVSGRNPWRCRFLRSDIRHKHWRVVEKPSAFATPWPFNLVCCDNHRQVDVLLRVGVVAMTSRRQAVLLRCVKRHISLFPQGWGVCFVKSAQKIAWKQKRNILRFDFLLSTGSPEQASPEDGAAAQPDCLVLNIPDVVTWGEIDV